MRKELTLNENLQNKIWKHLDKDILEKYSKRLFWNAFIDVLEISEHTLRGTNQKSMKIFNSNGGLRNYFAHEVGKSFLFTDTVSSSLAYIEIYKRLKKRLKENEIVFNRYESSYLILDKQGIIHLELRK